MSMRLSTVDNETSLRAGRDTTPNNDGPPWPPLTIIDTSFTDVDVALAVMCAGIRLTVFIYEDDLLDVHADDSESHASTFRTYLKNTGDLIDEFEDWAITPCLPFLQQLQTVGQRVQTRFLADYLRAPTFALKLEVHNGILKPVACPRDLVYEATIFSGCPLTDLAIMGIPAANVQSYKSDELVFSKHGSSMDEEFCAIPRSVQTANEPGRQMAYKPIRDRDSFRREVTTLLQVQRRLPDSKVNIPKFIAFVKRPDGELIEGFLSTFVESAQPMTAVRDEYDLGSRETWMRQIREAVYALHEADLTWGDAKPDNVLIDKLGNAWVIDFGGGWSPPWVDVLGYDTPEGDLQALERIDIWLLQA